MRFWYDFTTLTDFGTRNASNLFRVKTEPSISLPPTTESLILVVEDKDSEMEFVTSSLASEGLSYITASSVATAITALEENNKISLLLLDWGLDRCGAEVLRRARVLYPKMPVIVMSGQPYDVRTDAIIGQADSFLSKPFCATVLNRQIMQLLERCEVPPKKFLPERMEDIRSMAEVKEFYIRHVLRLLDGNVSLAAQQLGIHRQTLARFASPKTARPKSKE
jgi:DNA-binding NtrC family response regulator